MNSSLVPNAPWLGRVLPVAAEEVVERMPQPSPVVER
jgi:hypothetical protein